MGIFENIAEILARGEQRNTVGIMIAGILCVAIFEFHWGTSLLVLVPWTMFFCGKLVREVELATKVTENTKISEEVTSLPSQLSVTQKPTSELNTEVSEDLEILLQKKFIVNGISRSD